MPGDSSALVPGGVRIGTPALTTRGLDAADFVAVADFLDKARPCLLPPPASSLPLLLHFLLLCLAVGFLLLG